MRVSFYFTQANKLASMHLIQIITWTKYYGKYIDYEAILHKVAQEGQLFWSTKELMVGREWIFPHKMIEINQVEYH